MRKELKKMRLINFLTQEKMAERCNTSRNNYAMIENGKREGNADFWFTLQSEFNIPIEKLNEMRQERG